MVNKKYSHAFLSYKSAFYLCALLMIGFQIVL